MTAYAFNGYNTYDVVSYQLSGGYLRELLNIPAGRTAASGGQPCAVTSLHPFWSGRYGSRAGSYCQLGGFGTEGFTLADGGGGVAQQNLTIFAPFGGAGVVPLEMHYGGAINFGRKTNVPYSITVDGTSSSWASSSIGGYFDWGSVPSAPQMVSATPGAGGSVEVRFSGSGVDAGGGGLSITGWKLQYADNPSFNAAITVDGPSSGIATFNLTSGKTYWFRASGRNRLADYWGTTGPWSASISATMLTGGPRIKSGGQWKALSWKTKVGGSMKTLEIREKINGSWKSLG